MGYGEVAVHAVLLCKEHNFSPSDAWSQAARIYFPTRLAAREKGCPKGAFLGLCSEGLVRYVQKRSYSRAFKSQSYAVTAVRLLQMRDDSHSELMHPTKLWGLVMATEGKSLVPNGQMDVVLGLGSLDCRPDSS